jgi:hypothetical protein
MLLRGPESAEAEAQRLDESVDTLAETAHPAVHGGDQRGVVRGAARRGRPIDR